MNGMSSRSRPVVQEVGRGVGRDVVQVVYRGSLQSGSERLLVLSLALDGVSTRSLESMDGRLYAEECGRRRAERAASERGGLVGGGSRGRGSSSLAKITAIV